MEEAEVALLWVGTFRRCWQDDQGTRMVEIMVKGDNGSEKYGTLSCSKDK